MNSVLLPIAYLGSVEMYAYILAADKVYVEACENYIKQTCRTRTGIYSANGKLQLTIPVKKVSGTKIAIKETKLHFAENWHKEHWTAICSAYNSSPFFEYYKDDLSSFFQNPPEKLWEFNFSLMSVILELLSIDKPVYETDDYRNVYTNDIIDLRYMEKAIEIPEYSQVFSNKYGFIAGLSIVDLLFNLGPDSYSYLNTLIPLLK